MINREKPFSACLARTYRVKSFARSFDRPDFFAAVGSRILTVAAELFGSKGVSCQKISGSFYERILMNLVCPLMCTWHTYERESSILILFNEFRPTRRIKEPSGLLRSKEKRVRSCTYLALSSVRIKPSLRNPFGITKDYGTVYFVSLTNKKIF